MPNLQGGIFIDQITDDIYTYDYTNKLLISSGEIDHDMTEDLQRFLRNYSSYKLQFWDGYIGFLQLHQCCTLCDGQDIIFKETSTVKISNIN